MHKNNFGIFNFEIVKESRGVYCSSDLDSLHIQNLKKFPVLGQSHLFFFPPISHFLPTIHISIFQGCISNLKFIPPPLLDLYFFIIPNVF